MANRWSAEYDSENLTDWSRQCDRMDGELDAIDERLWELENKRSQICAEYTRTENAAAEELREIDADAAAAAFDND